MTDRVLNDIYSIRIPVSRSTTLSPYCESCKNGVVHLTSLEVRRFSQSGQLPNVCRNCNKEFLKICRIQIRNMNQPESSHTCEDCGKSFIHAGNLKKHQLLHKDNVDASSSADVNGTPGKVAEISDNQSDYLGFQNRSCLCKECGKQFSNEYAFLKHCQFHVNKSNHHACLVCNTLFDGGTEYKAHMISHEEKSEYVCSICPKTFVKISELKLHCISTHEVKEEMPKNIPTPTPPKKKDNSLQNGGGRQKFACNKCDKIFVQRPAYMKHCQQHEDSVPYFCTVCSKIFTNEQTFQAHQLTHGSSYKSPGKRQRYHCKICNKGFKLRKTYMKHRKFHK